MPKFWFIFKLERPKGVFQWKNSSNLQLQSRADAAEKLAVFIVQRSMFWQWDLITHSFKRPLFVVDITFFPFLVLLLCEKESSPFLFFTLEHTAAPSFLGCSASKSTILLLPFRLYCPEAERDYESKCQTRCSVKNGKKRNSFSSFNGNFRKISTWRLQINTWSRDVTIYL